MQDPNTKCPTSSENTCLVFGQFAPIVKKPSLDSQLWRNWAHLDFQIFSFGATGLTLIAFLELIAVMYVYGHKRFTDDIENMTGASQGFPSSFTETLFRRSPRTVLADHVEVHLAGLDVRGDRLLHLLPPHQQPQVLRLEQRAGFLTLISEKGLTFHLFETQAKSEDREYTHTGLVFAAILAIASLVPVAGGAILHVIRRCGIKFLCPVTIVFHPGCRTRTITSPQ